MPQLPCPDGAATKTSELEFDLSESFGVANGALAVETALRHRIEARCNQAINELKAWVDTFTCQPGCTPAKNYPAGVPQIACAVAGGASGTVRCTSTFRITGSIVCVMNPNII